MSIRENEYPISVDDGTSIAGTLTRPIDDGPHPVALLLSPGVLDRNGDTAKTKLGYGAPLASALADQGIASYRFDRRATGQTPGDVRTVTWTRNREDAQAVVRHLAARDDLGPLALIGYSEGAINAAWLASRAEVAAVVLIGCPAETGEQSMLWWAGQLRPDEIPAPFKIILKLLRRTPRDQIGRFCAVLRRRQDQERPRLFGFRVPRSYPEYMTIDPVPDLEMITAPMLTLTGEKDRNINPDNVDKIATLVQGPVDVRRIPDLTHLLRRDLGSGSIRNYAELYRQPTDPELIELIASWTATQLKPG